MNSDQMQGKWKQIKGSVKERWAKLTDDDIDIINGKHDHWSERFKSGMASHEMRLKSRLMSIRLGAEIR